MYIGRGTAVIALVVAALAGAQPVGAADPVTVTWGTDITAQPSIAKVLAPDTAVFLTFTATLVAVSRDTMSIAHTPIAGAPVRMRVNSNTVCTATTNANGVATCGAAQDSLSSLTSGYTAVFDGLQKVTGTVTDRFLPSSYHSPSLLLLRGTPAPSLPMLP